MSVRLYVGNLPKEVLDRQELQDLFTNEGQAITTKIIKDRKSGQCRGFAFVTVKNEEHADQFIEKFNGYDYKDSPLKIEKALPRSKGSEGEGGENEGSPTEAPIITSSEPKAPIPMPEKVQHRDMGSGNAKKRNKKRRNDRQQQQSTSYIQPQQDFQPDPRWAAQLAKLKEMLSATNV
jgi:RNA recognition motif-containing protein